MAINSIDETMYPMTREYPPKAIALFGEVLFDQFPNGQQILGGAPFNVAWHLQAFAAAPCFISRVGADASGRAVLTAMADWGMDTTAVQIDTDHPTGVVQVDFENGQPQYQILANQAYDFIATELLPTQVFDLVYHGSLALRHQTSAQALTDLLARHTGLVFIDVNLRAPWWQPKPLDSWLQRADWAKLNDQELRTLMPAAEPLATLAEKFYQHYQLSGLIVTCGADGALALTRNGICQVRPSGTVEVVNTVGAGDAFASVILLGLHHGWPLAQTLNRAQDFASALVTQPGATVANQLFYQSFRSAWRL